MWIVLCDTDGVSAHRQSLHRDTSAGSWVCVCSQWHENDFRHWANAMEIDKIRWTVTSVFAATVFPIHSPTRTHKAKWCTRIGICRLECFLPNTSGNAFVLKMKMNKTKKQQLRKMAESARESKSNCATHFTNATRNRRVLVQRIERRQRSRHENKNALHASLII